MKRLFTNFNFYFIESKGNRSFYSRGENLNGGTKFDFERRRKMEEKVGGN